jgi:fructokinase
MIDISAFGEVLFDIYETGPHTLVRVLGGAPANLCVGAARLGARTQIVGGIGRDRFGDALSEMLRKESVSTASLARLPERTGITFIKQLASGEPSFLFYRQQTADVCFRAKDLKASAGKAKFGVIGSSTAMAKGLRDATEAYWKRCESFGGRRVLDLNVRAHLWPDKAVMRSTIRTLAQNADIIKASSDDLAHLGNPLPLAWAPKAIWFLTRGGKAATILHANQAYDVPTKETRTVVDATGAGDAFLAGVLTALSVSAGAKTSTSKRAFLRADQCVAAAEVGHLLARKAIRKLGATAGLTELDAIHRKIQTIRRLT